MQAQTIFSKRLGSKPNLNNKVKEGGGRSDDIISEIVEVGVQQEDIIPNICEKKEKHSGTLTLHSDSKKKSSSNDQDNTGIKVKDESSKNKVPDRNHKTLAILLPITGMFISFASLGIGMNAGYKADSPVVWGPLTFSIVCMLTLVGLCNSKASNSIKPQAVRELNPAISSKGFGPY